MNQTIRSNHLRGALTRGTPAFGPNLQIPSTDLVEIIGLAGYDYIMLDGEHGAAFTRLPELLVACDAAGLTSIVRVPSHERSVLLPPLELGAGGLQIPFVNNAAEARAIVAETKYPPLGGRGLSAVSRAARYGFVDSRRYRSVANRETLVVVQLETREAMANAAEIAAVPGVDAIFIGPTDLAQSLGEPTGRLTAPTIKAIQQIIQAVLPLKPVSISAFDRHDVARWHKLGVRCFLTSSAMPLRKAFCDWSANLRAGLPR